MVLSKTPEQVREALERGVAQMGKARALEELTEVRRGLPLIMHAVKRSSVQTVEAVFAAMGSALDDDQVRVLGSGGYLNIMHVQYFIRLPTDDIRFYGRK